jgi:hypothetical protein
LFRSGKKEHMAVEIDVVRDDRLEIRLSGNFVGPTEHDNQRTVELRSVSANAPEIPHTVILGFNAEDATDVRHAPNVPVQRPRADSAT